MPAATKAKADSKPAAKKSTASKKRAAVPVVLNQFTRRSGDEPLLGSWVDIVSGPEQHRFGHYFEDVSNDPETGYPDRVHVRVRDATNDVVEVGLEDIRPSERNGGR